MKKIKTLLLTATVLASCFGTAFVGSSCGETQSIEKKESTMVELNGFESHLELDSILFLGFLGKMQLNKTETDYIVSGEASAKLTVDSDPNKAEIPQLRQATNLLRKDMDLSDFSFVKFVSLEIYNAQAESRDFEMQLVFSTGNGPSEKFELKPNAWTTVHYAVDREYIPTAVDAFGNESLPVDGINMTFERNQTEDEVYYLDDMRIYKTSMPAMPVTMELKENEFCSFDNLWQVKLVEKTDWSYTDVMPEFSYSSENTATGKGGSLCMRAPAASTNSYGGFAGVVFNKNMINMFPWAAYDDNDCLTFDVYSPKEGGIKKLWFNMYGSTTSRFFVKELDLPGGKWTTFSFPVSELNGQGTATELDNFAVTSLINITYMANMEGGVVYIDNIRMEVN